MGSARHPPHHPHRHRRIIAQPMMMGGSNGAPNMVRGMGGANPANLMRLPRSTQRQLSWQPRTL